MWRNERRAAIINPMRLLHRIYLSPGFFGFGKLGAFDYFEHVESELVHQLRAAGDEARTHVLNVLPTASIRRRACKLGELIAETAGPEGPIHIIGHSTGGLDARVIVSPDADVGLPPELLAWLPRVASVTTLNAPHYGTPMASFFSTVQGQRWLYVLSALTYVALVVGAPPLSIASTLLVAMRQLQGVLGLDVRLLDRVAESLLRVVDDARSDEIRNFIESILNDQGAVIQLMPESMDLFRAGINDRPGVRYQCVATMAPPPNPKGFFRSLKNPWETLSTAIFAAQYSITSRYDERYPCAARDVDDEAEAVFQRSVSRVPGARANDGVVPTLSQVWGHLVWAGYADHLDVLGHFRGRNAEMSAKGRHNDWLISGSEFNEEKFKTMMSRVADGIVASSERWRGDRAP